MGKKVIDIESVVAECKKILMKSSVLKKKKGTKNLFSKLKVLDAILIK